MKINAIDVLREQQKFMQDLRRNIDFRLATALRTAEDLRKELYGTELDLKELTASIEILEEQAEAGAKNAEAAPAIHPLTHVKDLEFEPPCFELRSDGPYLDGRRIPHLTAFEVGDVKAGEHSTAIKFHIRCRVGAKYDG